MKVYWLERLGSLTAGAGIIYATYVATKGMTLDDVVISTSITKILSETGPMEACALGILVWVYAKWRKHVDLH
ncbi:MAG: hypothetical protein JWO13_3050 [Acidobacteriales bacterium]|nr:hypothetical protein [Terriglobales bacterium]